MLRSKSFDLLSRRQEEERENERTLPRLKVTGSYGSDSPGLALDRAIVTDPEDTKRRRTIRLVRDTITKSWGFTLQTYGILNKKTSEVEVMSYVDYVELHGPAWVAGMRRGDIILSVNGDSVEYSTHMDLVQRIKLCKREMRLVVLFENCCKKVELHERYLKLKKLLAFKLKELKRLEEEEQLINQGVPLSEIDSSRRSTSSSISITSDWDAYSEIISPNMLNGKISNQFVFRNGVDSDTSSETSFTSDKWQPNASAESVSSSNPDSNPDCNPDSKHKSDGSEGVDRGFVQSSQSDFSEASENSEEGLKHLYNITRCADHLKEACTCKNFIPNKARSRSIEEASKEGNSMSNLVDDSGIQLRAIKEPTTKTGGKNVRGLRTPSSASSSSSSSRDQSRMKKGQFYVGSDSEESVVSADAERSTSLETSTSSNTDSRISGFSKGQMTLSTSVLEKDEDESEDYCQDNSMIGGKDNDKEIQNNFNASVQREVTNNPIAESYPCSDSSMRSPAIKANVDVLQWEAHGDSTAISINQAALSNAHLSLSLSTSYEDKLSSVNIECSSTSPDLSSTQTREKIYPQSQAQAHKNTNTQSEPVTVGHISDIPRKETSSSTVSTNISDTPENSRHLGFKSQTQTAVPDSEKPSGNTSHATPHSRNRLVDGILVNDQSQSTRL